MIYYCKPAKHSNKRIFGEALIVGCLTIQCHRNNIIFDGKWVSLIRRKQSLVSLVALRAKTIVKTLADIFICKIWTSFFLRVFFGLVARGCVHKLFFLHQYIKIGKSLPVRKKKIEPTESPTSIGGYAPDSTCNILLAFESERRGKKWTRYSPAISC